VELFESSRAEATKIALVLKQDISRIMTKMAFLICFIFCLTVCKIYCEVLSKEYNGLRSEFDSRILSINATLVPSEIPTFSPSAPTKSPSNIPTMKPTISYAPSVKYTNNWNESTAIVSLMFL
jgi:hypothetical protein